MMMDLLLDVFRFVYWTCTDFMIHSANLLGISYRDSNCLIIFMFMPAVTIILGLVWTWQHHLLMNRQ